MKTRVRNLMYYPNDGKHQECITNFKCFDISKGKDSYYYRDENGNEKKYNPYKKGKIDERWIVHLEDSANKSLKETFKVKLNKDLNVIIEYCKKIYVKSLKMEIERINNELESLDF